MKTYLTFKTVIFDTEFLRPGPIPASRDFFIDTSDNEESATIYPEQRIISWLFNMHEARNLILSELRIGKDCLFRFGVTEPVIKNRNSKPGDVDILLCPQKQPNKAIAIECKRVKVKAISSVNDKINKIEGVGNGVIQANSLRSIGFYQTYIAIFIISDGRERREFNTLSRGAAPSTFSRIYDFPLRDGIDSEVGVMFVEIVQPTGKRIDRMGKVAVCVDQYAKYQEQPTELTSRIRQAFCSRC